MRKFIAAIVLIMWPTCFVWASVNASGAITAANTFQQVFAANTARAGCAIQNNPTNTSTDSIYVYAGPIAGATRLNSFIIAPGAAFSCTTGIGLQNDQISVDGTTTGDKFYAEQW